MWKHVLFGGLLLCSVSCVSKRKLTYLRDGMAPGRTTERQDYRVRKGDALVVEIKSSDPASSNFYNLKTENNSGSYNDAFLYVNSLPVNATGDMSLPFLGSLKVEGLTVPEITTKIEVALADHLRNASVFVKLVSYEVTVLGEVNRPGAYNVSREGITLLQALGLAGDLTNYGKRNNIKVIRTDNNVSRTIEVDLRNYELLSSPAYFIYPHDVIYVSPLRVRSAEMNLKPVGVWLSGAAVLILILRTIDE